MRSSRSSIRRPSGAASLVYSTYLGGSKNNEAGLGIGVDSVGPDLRCRVDRFEQFPVTAGAYQTSRAGNDDSFVVQIDPSVSGTSALLYGTLLRRQQRGLHQQRRLHQRALLLRRGHRVQRRRSPPAGSYDTSYGGGTDAFVGVFTFDRPPTLTTTTARARVQRERRCRSLLDARSTVTDPDSPTLAGATRHRSPANYVIGEDVLAFNNSNPWGITGIWVAATGTLTLTGASSPSNYQAALRSVTYQNTSEKPSTATRTVSFTASDGVYNSATCRRRQITVTSVNDAPREHRSRDADRREDTSLVCLDRPATQISVVDVDAGTAAVQVTLTASNGKLTLSQTTGLSFVTGNGSGNTTMTFTGTVANIDAALNGLRFDPNANFNGAASLQVVTNDQGNSGSGGPRTTSSTVAINVTAVNDAPIASVPGPQSTPQNTVLVFSSGTGNAITHRRRRCRRRGRWASR